MKIAVLGAGAMGGIVAIGLHRGGHHALIIDPWRPHVEAIRTSGFLMTGVYSGEPVRWQGTIPALHTDELAQLQGKLDVVFLSVKAYNTRWAAQLIQPHLAPEGMVVSVQNGINEPVIAEVVGPGRTIGCETLMGGQTWEPGHIHRTQGGVSGVMDYVIGEYAGGVTPRVERLAQMLRGCVGTCGVSDHIMDEVWTKFVVNCGGNLLAAITSWDTRELSLAGTARLRWALQDEAITVGERLGVKFGGFGGSVGVILTPQDVKEAAQGQRPDLEQQVLEGAKKMVRVTRPSTLHDALRGTPMEVEELNGYLVARAEALEVPVPYNRALVRVARLVNEHKLRPYPANLALFQEYVQQELARAQL
jgi:2-dehydropantoate 2-reductase